MNGTRSGHRHRNSQSTRIDLPPLAIRRHPAIWYKRYWLVLRSRHNPGASFPSSSRPADSHGLTAKRSADYCSPTKKLARADLALAYRTRASGPPSDPRSSQRWSGCCTSPWAILRNKRLSRSLAGCSFSAAKKTRPPLAEPKRRPSSDVPFRQRSVGERSAISSERGHSETGHHRGRAGRLPPRAYSISR